MENRLPQCPKSFFSLPEQGRTFLLREDELQINVQLM